MLTTITARHCAISDALRRRAVAVTERLATHAPRPLEATVVFDTEGSRQLVELRLRVSRGITFIAKGQGMEHRTALDRAEDRLRRQLEKANGRPRRVRQARPSVAKPT